MERVRRGLWVVTKGLENGERGAFGGQKIGL